MTKLNIIKNGLLILGVVIVLNLFFNAGVKAFYKEPKYEDFCKQELTAVQYKDRGECEAIGGAWSANQNYVYDYQGVEKTIPAPIILDRKTTEPTGYCDAQYSCRKEFDKANEVYLRNVFIVLVLTGLIALIVGFLVAKSSAVSLGLSAGGVISIIVGSIRYWSAMNEYLRFIMLGVALVVLIWFGIKKFSDINSAS